MCKVGKNCVRRLLQKCNLQRKACTLHMKYFWQEASCCTIPFVCPFVLQTALTYVGPSVLPSVQYDDCSRRQPIAPQSTLFFIFSSSHEQLRAWRRRVDLLRPSTSLITTKNEPSCIIILGEKGLHQPISLITTKNEPSIMIIPWFERNASTNYLEQQRMQHLIS